MVWLPVVIILFAGAWFVLRRKPQQSPSPKRLPFEDPHHSSDVFERELAEAIVTYEKDQLAYAFQKMVILEGHCDAILASFAAQYGRCDGVPFLDLPGAWNPRTREVIRAWMAQNGMNFRENAPAVQQLEQALEARIDQQAQQILERIAKSTAR